VEQIECLPPPFMAPTCAAQNNRGAGPCSCSDIYKDCRDTAAADAATVNYLSAVIVRCYNEPDHKFLCCVVKGMGLYGP
jgi:hypothetical protein